MCSVVVSSICIIQSMAKDKTHSQSKQKRPDVGHDSQMSTLEKGDHTVLMDCKLKLNLHETTEAMGIMRSLFHYYTQITTLENGGQKV